MATRKSSKKSSEHQRRVLKKRKMGNIKRVRNPKRKLRSGGLNAKLKPSTSLSAIVGSGSQSRGQVTKKLWSYIKRHKLQVPSNMRMIKPDAKLAKVFGGKSAISMFTMTKKVSKHLS